MEIFNKTLELERFLAPFYQEKKHKFIALLFKTTKTN